MNGYGDWFLGPHGACKIPIFHAHGIGSGLSFDKDEFLRSVGIAWRDAAGRDEEKGSATEEIADGSNQQIHHT